MYPKISVIVPVYNAERWLHRCVDSILAQTYTDFELLLIDDGSTDSSSDICDEYALVDPRVRVLHKPNGGVSSARNLGLDNVRGEWITFVDADDWIDDNFLKAIQVYNVDLTIGDFCLFNTIQTWSHCHVPNGVYENEDIKRLISKYPFPAFHSPWGKLFRKSIIDNQHLRFNEKLKRGEDTIFVYNYVLYSNHIYCTNIACYNYIYSNCGLTSKYDFATTSEFSKELYKVACKLKSKYKLKSDEFIHNCNRGNLAGFFPSDIYKLQPLQLRQILIRIKEDENISKILDICANKDCGKKAKIFFPLYSKHRYMLIFLWIRFCRFWGKSFV